MSERNPDGQLIQTKIQSAVQGGKILVTGGTGFLGGYIIRRLVEKGIEVRAIKRSGRLPFFIPEEVLQKVEWVEGNVLDVVSLSDAMQQVYGVIHAAAVVSFSPDNRREMYQVNVEGTANVLNSALENNVKRLVHVSSVAALGRTTVSETISENKKWETNKNNTNYAISKHQAEMHVWRSFAEGISGVIINPSTILGYGDWHQSSCAIFRNIYKGFPWYTKGVNGFVGVEDVAEATVQLLFSNITEEKFIVNAENWNFQHLFNIIADHMHKKRPYRHASRSMGEIAWRLEKIRALFRNEKPLLTRETARVGHSRTSFDNRTLLRALPDFQYTPLDTVIKEASLRYLKAIEEGRLKV